MRFTLACFLKLRNASLDTIQKGTLLFYRGAVHLTIFALLTGSQELGSSLITRYFHKGFANKIENLEGYYSSLVSGVINNMEIHRLTVGNS